MKGTVLMTSLSGAFEEALALAFAREGWRVYALGAASPEAVRAGIAPLPEVPEEAARALAAQAGRIDYYLDTTDARDEADGATVREGLDGAATEALYRRNVLRPMALLEAFLPLLDAGEGKRLFFVSSARACINETRDTAHYGYNMSKAALHQFLQMVRNRLAPAGYTLRAYDPLRGEVPPALAAEGALHYALRRRGTENNDPRRDDETHLVLRDALGRQHAW